MAARAAHNVVMVSWISPGGVRLPSASYGTFVDLVVGVERWIGGMPKLLHLRIIEESWCGAVGEG